MSLKKKSGLLVRWWSAGLALLMSVGMLFGLGLTAQAQTPTPGAAQPPTWFKDLPVYQNLEKLEVDDSLLAGFSSLGIDRSKFYFSLNLSSDAIGTIADFYTARLEAADWKGERTPLVSETLAQQLQYANPKIDGSQLIILVASKSVLKLAPQFRELDAKVPDGKNIVLIAAPLPGAVIPTVPSGATTTTPAAASGIATPAASAAVTSAANPKVAAEPPAWFRIVPTYPKLQKVELDPKSLAAADLDPSEFYITAGLTTDPVATVAEYYTSRLKAQGVGSPRKTALPKEEIGQQLVYSVRGDLLLAIIASKQAVGLVPQLKDLEKNMQDGQTLVVLVAPVGAPPVKGAKCQPGVECAVGPYKVLVTFDRATFNTTDSFAAAVERKDKPGNAWKLQADLVPGNNTEATLVKLNGSWENGTAPVREVKASFPIAGSWYVAFAINDSAGEARFYLPVTVEAPPLLDEGLAWVIGLFPLIGIVGFIIGQWRLVVRRRQAERQAGIAPGSEPQSIAGLAPSTEVSEPTEAEPVNR